MNYILTENTTPLLEAFLLLGNIINDNNPKDQQENLLKCPTPAATQVAMKLDTPIKVYNSVKEHISSNLDRLNFFFKTWEDPHTSLASLLFASTLDTSFNDQLANFKAFSSEERFEFLKGCVLSVGLDENIIDKNNPEYDMIKTEKDLFNCIEKIKDLSYEHKYHLLLLYYHFEDLLQELHTILLDTLSIMEPFFREMQVTVTDFVEDFKRNLTEDGLYFFEKEFGITLKSDKLKIYPTFNGFNNLTLENFLGRGSYDHMFLGIYLFEIIRLRNDIFMDEKNLAPFLKAISDPSKLEILKLLKYEKLYASQLAEKLQISNATISHHVSTLLNLNLLTFEKEQTKIYFSLNKEKVQIYLTLLQRVFE